MFRYNAYFGIHTVYYMDLGAHTRKQPLPMPAIILAAVKKGENALNAWTKNLFDKLDNLKFLVYFTEEGFPSLVPVIQSQSAGTQHLIFAPGAFTRELKAIPKGIPMALFGLSLDMTDVLTRGIYQGIRWVGPHRCGVLKVDWVYNSMPPVPQQIYPPLPLEPIRTFEE